MTVKKVLLRKPDGSQVDVRVSLSDLQDYITDSFAAIKMPFALGIKEDGYPDYYEFELYPIKSEAPEPKLLGVDRYGMRECYFVIKVLGRFVLLTEFDQLKVLTPEQALTRLRDRLTAIDYDYKNGRHNKIGKGNLDEKRLAIEATVEAIKQEFEFVD